MGTKPLFRIGILVLFTLIHAACGSSGASSAAEGTFGSSSGQFQGACDHTNLANTNNRQCREWHGSGFESFDLSVSCAGIGGVYSAGQCSSANLAGTCFLGKGTNMETRFLYYLTDFTQTTAQSNCLLKDTTGLGGDLIAIWVPN